MQTESSITVIEARKRRFAIDWKELAEYRDLYYFLVWRSIKAKYAQSVLGVGWAVVQPLTQMLIFTLILGKGLKVASDGVPYALFSFSALVPWAYFSNALNEAVGGLNANRGMLSKVYFPRLIIPMTSVLSRLVDFSIALGVFFLLMLFYGRVPTADVVFFPWLVVVMMMTAAGAGMWLSSLAIQYRDIQYAMGFATQLMMWATPVVYPLSIVPEGWRYLYGLNPMVGVIESARSMFLDTRPMPWGLLVEASVTAGVLFFSGMLYFRYKERLFADVA